MNLWKKNHIKYGIIMCLVTIVCLFFMEITGNNDTFDSSSPFQIIYMFIAPFVVWYLGIRAVKRENGNTLTIKQGLKAGLRISLVYGIISPFIFLFYYLLFNPEIIEYVRTAYGMLEASRGQVIGIDMVVQFISAIVFGTIYALIITLILKKKPIPAVEVVRS